MTAERRNPSTPPEVVQPGDVLFFAPEVERKDFSDFAQLAAYAQRAPWHHVAIAGEVKGGEPEVIGFGQTRDPDRDGSNWDPRVGRHEWEPATSGCAVTALRPPRRAQDVVAGAEEMLGKEYAVVGLLAFAAATQGRMFMAGRARERTLDFAAGAEVEGRKRSSGHTCVTAVVHALERARFDLEFRESEPPPKPIDPVIPEMHENVEELYRRLQNGGQKLDAPAPGVGDELLSHHDIADGWDLGAFTHVPGPGLVKTTQEYLDLMASVIRHEFPDRPTADQLVRLGQCERPNDGSVDGWRVGPPMLRSTLLGRGFTEVR